jgi:Lrp/AsnC family leucine-responsive transcriptional regulator
MQPTSRSASRSICRLLRSAGASSGWKAWAFYVALLDPAAIGLGVRAISYVTLSRHGGDEGSAFEREIKAIPEVLECYAVAGESDYILQIVAADLGVLSESVLRVLTRIKGVANIRSNIVLNCIKSSTELPLGHIGKVDGAARKVRIAG